MAPTERTVVVHEWVTGGGLAGSDLPPSWASEGRAMRRAIAADFASVSAVRVIATLDHRLGDEPGPWTTVAIGPGEERESFARLAAGADWTVVVAPETAGILADRTRMVERAGGRSLGSTAAAIELAGDKLRMGAYWRDRGIRTPAVERIGPRGTIPASVAFPAVIKPIDGAGAVDTFFLADEAAIPRESGSPGESLVQPFVPGCSMSASFLVDLAGRARLIAVGSQRVEVRDSRFVYLGGIVPDHRPIDHEALRRAVELVAGLRGFVGLDFIREDGGQLTFLEINPRPTTSYAGLARLLPAGLLAWSWLAIMEGAGDEPACRLDLAEAIRSHASLTFNADGTIACESEGAPP